MTSIALPSDVVNIDHPSTWPCNVAKAVTFCLQLSGDLSEVAHFDELELPEAGRVAIEKAIRGLRIAGYHATRLLPHERQSIRDKGLKPLTSEGITQRIRQAVQCETLDPQLAEVLIRFGTTAAKDPARQGNVCLTSSSKVIMVRHYFGRLFTYWGGEAIRNELPDKDPILEQLAKMGSPTVVTAGIPLQDLQHRSFNVDLPLKLVAARLNLAPGGSMFVSEVHSDNILDIALEGSTQWNSLQPMTKNTL